MDESEGNWIAFPSCITESKASAFPGHLAASSRRRDQPANEQHSEHIPGDF